VGKKKKQHKTKPKRSQKNDWRFREPLVWGGTAEAFLASAPQRGLFDLVITSQPYNLGKEYEREKAIGKYLLQQKRVIEQIVKRIRPNGSICWQVGNYVKNGEILPLDIEFHKIFRRLGMKLRNRIIWRFGHGLHASRRFSGRYEVILWYTKSDKYIFNLDSVRIQSKYPGKLHYKGPNRGKPSGHPEGKNPEDVWDDVWQIPNVKGNHVEKTSHPCQFPIGLAERLVLALTKKNAVVFDPFAGVSSAGAAALTRLFCQ